MSVAPPLSTLMFSPRTRGAGAAWPGPHQLLLTPLSWCPALGEWTPLWREERSHTVTLVCVIINEDGLFVCCDGRLSQYQYIGLRRIIKKPISQSLGRVFGCYLPLDQFYLLLFFYWALKLSLCWWWYRAPYIRSGWHYFRITQLSDSSGPGNTSSVVTL